MNLRIRNILIFASLIVALIFSASRVDNVEAQRPAQAVVARAFETGEELFYEAEFSRALLRNIDVADFRFSASRSSLSGSPANPNGTDEVKPYALTFNADIASKGFFTRLFNLRFRERVESTVEPVSFTIQKTTILDEQGKRVRATEATFDRRKGKMFWTQRDPNDPTREPRSSITDFSGQLQDVLSAIYFIRMQRLAVGKSFEIFIGDGGHVYRVPVQVVEKKRMKTILGRVNVVRVDPDLFGPDRLIYNQKGQFSLWLTDDDQHIPVGGRIKTDYGTFDIKLKRVVNNPPA